MERAYSAPCPGCGAPVEFASAQSIYAVCAFCRSSIVRSGEVLERRGRVAEVFEDYSPLQIGTQGQVDRNGGPQAFRLIGRLQLKGEAGGWSEWVAALDDGSLGTLSEDNGQWSWSWPWTLARSLPGYAAGDWPLNQEVRLDGQTFTVTSVQNVHLAGAQGELNQLPDSGRSFMVVELRDTAGRIASVDFSSVPPLLSLGQPVELETLQLQGLRALTAKKESGRHFNCPQCAAVVPVKLDATQSISCPSCGSLIDLSAGIGAELRHALQHDPVRPQIPLGSQGRLEGADWQVVGFQHRSGQEAGDDERFGWQEYLLYSRKAGFAFLVDSTAGWSMVRATHGQPKLSKNGETANYMARHYQLESRYTATTTYALGEFYWPVKAGQTTRNADYLHPSSKATLSQEIENRESTWSHGTAISAQTLAQAFGVPQLRGSAEVSPLSGSRFSLPVLVFGAVLLWMLVSGLRGCMSSPSCDPQTDANCSSRSSGATYGGWTSGGSHK